VISCLVGILFVIIIIVLIIRCQLRKPPVIPFTQQSYRIDNQQPYPQTHQIYVSEGPPPYNQVMENKK
jgi:hypothetical protein